MRFMLKRNPSLKWHRKQEDVALKQHKGAMTKLGGKFYEGKVAAQQDSIRKEWSMKKKRKKNPVWSSRFPALNAQNLEDLLVISSADAKDILKRLKSSGGVKSIGSSGRDVEETMEYIDKKIKGFGVEAIYGGSNVGGYWQDAVAIYVNTGDTYNGTIVYETRIHKFYITTIGDWVETRDKKYKIM